MARPVSGLQGAILIGSCEMIMVTDATLNVGPANEGFHTVGGGKYQLTVETGHTGEGTINGIVDEDGLATSVMLPGQKLTATFRSATGIVYTGQIRLGQFQYTFQRSGEVQRVSIPFMTHGSSTGSLANTPA
jgi:hypothetical protein